MEFRKYQHIERWGTSSVEGIELGDCVVMPKVDGTNANAWLGEDGVVCAGNRKRKLSLEDDNAGFCRFVFGNKNIQSYLERNPTHRLFGEWLVPHSLKTYRAEAWKKFYIFDVCVDKGESLKYLPFKEYKPLLEEFDLDYIEPLAIIKNPSYEQLISLLKQNTFLIEDGKGVGEGIVIKRYDFVNRFGRQVWAKIVTSDFKEKHRRAMGSLEMRGKDIIEEVIVRDFCSGAFIEKEFAKIVNEKGGWESKLIPMLLGRVYHEFVQEEIWNAIKKHRNPTINFKTLNYFIMQKVKEVKSDVF